MRRDVHARTGSARDLALYERLIDDGIAMANAQGGVIDHVTARRIAIWLASRPQQSDFTRGLIRFAQSGVITHALKTQLRNYARSAGYPHRPQAARPWNTRSPAAPISARSAPTSPPSATRSTGPTRCSPGCATGVREGRGLPEPAWPDADGQRFSALARRDPDSRTISLILDTTTANIAMHAIAVHAGDREAHVREIEQYGQNLPEDSYGRLNRQAIAARGNTGRHPAGAVERAYRTAIDPDAMPEFEAAETLRFVGMAPDHELELE
jgi:hypothetical protein